MNWQLTLRSADAPQRAACAWFVPGDSAEAWLTALAALPLDQSRARLLIVPQSATDRRPLGALIFAEATIISKSPRQPAEDLDGSPHDHHPFVFAYGSLVDRLYVPIEAVVSPPASGPELNELLADDQLYVWHPVAGLVPFTAADCLRPSELLAPPVEVESHWDRAVPGVAYNTRLLSLSAAIRPSLSQMIEQVRGEIGTRSNELSSLPPTPREPRPGILSSIKRGLTTICARLALGLSRLGLAGRESVAGAGAAAGRMLRWALLTLLVLAGVAGLALIAYWLWQLFTQPSGSSAAGGGWLWLLLACGLLLLALVALPKARLKLSPRFRRFFQVLFVYMAIALVVQVAQSHTLDDAMTVIIFAVVAGILLARLLGSLFRMGPSRSPLRPGNRPTQPQRPAAASGAGGGWLRRLGAWATAKLGTVHESIQSARNREIERLVHLLDTDPDAGLRYALPLAADPPRGVGAPGTTLTTRTVDFGARSGSGPGDPWAVQAEHRRKLTERYRNLANREISLGRHRRAAYILAQLLGDWTSAASTLADGGHHREAAIIYDERLHRPMEAAKCLENGGLLTEAIVAYEKLAMHEKIGDLYTQLEQPAEAEQAYRRAVDARRNGADRVAAATLLETKLHLPEEAWDELAGGWPASRQAEHCLREAFNWTERHRDSERAKQFLHDAAARARSSQEAVTMASRAAELAGSYPEPSVQAAAAETVLAIASPRLPQAAGAELTGLTAALRRLAPDDRLLARDCDRYQRDRAAAPLPPALPSSRAKQLQLRRTIKLPFDNVRTCVASADSFYAAGWRHSELLVIRGNWQGAVQYPDRSPWKYPKAMPDTAILMAVEAIEEETVCVHPVGQSAAAYQRTFPPVDGFRRALAAGAFAGLSAHTVALTAGARVQVVDLGLDAIHVRGYRAADFHLVATVSCDCPDIRTLRFPLPYQEREEVHYVAVGRTICFIRGGQFKELHECDDEIVGLVASPAHTRPRLVAVFERGAQILWGVVRGASATTLAADMVRPQVMLHRDGWIIAADRRGCQVLHVERDALQLHMATEWDDRGEVVALVALPVPHVFAVSFSSGEIRQYQIPSAH